LAFFHLLYSKKKGIFSFGGYRRRALSSKVNAVDLCTETDKKVEQLIRTRLLEAYPEDQFIGRDSGASH
jgi:fructose-1,6-bisphosphatase/inositol monophosphatase family enzyme